MASLDSTNDSKSSDRFDHKSAHNAHWAHVANDHNVHLSALHRADDAHKQNQQLDKLGFPHPTLDEQKVRDLKGNFCKTQPEPGRYPVIERNKKPEGCDFKDLKADGPSPEQYAKERGQIAHLRVVLEQHGQPVGVESGTGVMIGKAASKPGVPADSCLIVTDNHVTEPDNETHLQSIHTYVNGQHYDAKKLFGEKSDDIAVVALKTGDKTAQVCKPAEFVDQAAESGKGYVGGFPRESNLTTISPLHFKGISPLNKVDEIKRFRHFEGENFRRDLQVTDGNTLEGDSGAPLRVINSGKVTGLLSGGIPGKYNFATATPMTQEKVDELVKRAQEKLLNK